MLYVCQGGDVTFPGLISGVLKKDAELAVGWVADKTGKIHPGEGKLL
jgi:hypothetical protein